MMISLGDELVREGMMVEPSDGATRAENETVRYVR
jgi:hypothetical protein